MYFVGLDACRNGWFAVSLCYQGNWKIDIYKTIGDLGKAFQKAALIFIDMPIGLPHANRRLCDLQTRKIWMQSFWRFLPDVR
jgi:predicted RNase H-like nuclease